jgi:deoxyribonuclease-4
MDHGQASTLKPLLGVHVSVAGGLPNAYRNGSELGCGAIQIFVKNANQWRGRELLDEEVAAFRDARAESGIGPLLAHASYLINLSATDPEILARSREGLADELVRCGRLGVDGLVLHPGAHLGAGEETGIERVAESLDRVLGSLPEVTTRVLLENTAGQGTCLGHRLEHLAEIRARVAAPERVGVCIDTCHAFAAGYAIHEEGGYGEFVAELNERIGLGQVGGFHVNDSVRPFGSRRDRHAHIGEGEIGLGLFERLVNDPRLAEIPMVVETDPEKEMGGHRRDLAVLRGLLPGQGRKEKRKGRRRPL